MLEIVEKHSTHCHTFHAGSYCVSHDREGSRGGHMGDAAELSPGRVLDDAPREGVRGLQHREHSPRVPTMAHLLPLRQGRSPVHSQIVKEC